MSDPTVEAQAADVEMVAADEDKGVAAADDTGAEGGEESKTQATEGDEPPTGPKMVPYQPKLVSQFRVCAGNAERDRFFCRSRLK